MHTPYIAFSMISLLLVTLLGSLLNVTQANSSLNLLELPAKESSELFLRSGQIQQLTLTISTRHLFC